MLAPASHPASLQRSIGSIRIGVRRVAASTALDDLAQSGCLRACFPRHRGGPLQAVVVNTAGGIADGDKLRIEARVATGAELIVTTPSADRIYRALPDMPAAQVDATFHVEDGAHLDFLPQETILFQDAALDRTTSIHVRGQGRYLGAEALIFGRAASGEAVTRLRLRDTIMLRRDGRLVLHESIRLHGDVGGLMARPACSGGKCCLANLVYAAPDAAARLDGVRDALRDTPSENGASSWDGILVVRILAAGSQALRQSIVAALAVLRSAKPLPRVWDS